ncbi:MAG: right-handed parallel beta-helix repeat-containing protein [Planctomycetota bacterium]
MKPCPVVAARKAPQKGVAMKTPRVVLRKLMIALAAIAAGTLVPAGIAGTTYYVNGTCGNNTWTGTSPVCTGPNGPKRTIQTGIDATVSGDEVVVADGVYTGAGNKNLDFGGRLITLRSAGGPGACVIDCAGSGRGIILASGETSDAVIQGFTITNGSGNVGGAMLLDRADATIIDCVFANSTADVGGAFRHDGLDETTLVGCTFSGNSAVVGGGAIASFGPGKLRVAGCVFTDNEADGAAAVASAHLEAAFVNCLFARNIGGFVAGGIADGSGYAALVNCVLSRNEAGMSAGAEFGSSEVLLVNTTVASNLGGGITCNTTEPEFRNCVLWGNSPSQIEASQAGVTYSDVEGGWPGTGNIDADPLFVQPGTDNVRLSVGSPCVNVANNAALPPDDFDLDGDGNTSEPLPVDLDGMPRVQGGTVDMGAFEGEFDPEAPAAGESDLDYGESAVLVPTGGDLDPLEAAAMLVKNTSGPDDATVVVTEYESDLYPEAGGYSELSCILKLETSLAEGQFLATQFIPFDASNLRGIDPGQVNLTRYDPEAGNWALAVTGNTANSPGHDGSVGDRVMSLEGGPWNVSNQLGDYGVYWDPAVGQGFAWAKVDVTEAFGLGVALCPADCLQTPDGKVSVLDFLALLARWGDASVGGPCDIDFDGMIGLEDFYDLLDSWGPCPSAARASAAGGSAPIGRRVPIRGRPGLAASAGADRVGLARLRAAWGRRGDGRRADLDGDGVVGVKDFLALLAAWPPE